MELLHYILGLEISDILMLAVYLAVICVIGYIASMLIIGLPCSVIETLSKKKIPDETQDKIIRIVAIILDVVLFIKLLQELV